MLTRAFTTDLPVDLAATLRPLRTGAGDLTMRLRADHAVRAWRTPEGPVTLWLHVTGGRVEAQAAGQGAVWALEHAPGLVGAHDDLTGFTPQHRLVERAHRRQPGLRICRTGLVTDALVPTILAQKVTASEANRPWWRMVSWWGEPAPDAPFLRLPPTPERLAATPYWAYHRLGVERRRAETIMRACRRAERLQEAVAIFDGGDCAAATARLTALPGLGPWTAAWLLRVAAGDADAVEVGDYHVKNQIAWALSGEPRGDDARMLELLACYAGHRGRVVRLLAGHRAPAFAAKRPIRRVELL